MKRGFALLAALALLLCAAGAEESGTEERDYARLLCGLIRTVAEPGETSAGLLREDAARSGGPAALAVARDWETLWLEDDVPMTLYREDDPAGLPAAGRHAFVVLGFELARGEMDGELITRCNAAAAAARAFPDAVLICSGGATGYDNPEGHTEAGLMKRYLSGYCGIDPERILTEEQALNTADNARNCLAILRERGIGSATLVTSSDHLKRSLTLFRAAAARTEETTGFAVTVDGGFCPDTMREVPARDDAVITIFQLCDVLELPQEQRDLVLTFMGEALAEDDAWVLMQEGRLGGLRVGMTAAEAEALFGPCHSAGGAYMAFDDPAADGLCFRPDGDGGIAEIRMAVPERLPPFGAGMSREEAVVFCDWPDAAGTAEAETTGDGTAYRMEYRVETPDGEPLVLRLDFDGDGGLVGLAVGSAAP